MKICRSRDTEEGCNRWIFLGANAFFWVLGWSLLIVGIWIYSDQHVYSIMVRPSFNPMSSAALCVSCGLAVVIIGFIGFIGAVYESKCMLVVYFLFVAFLFFVQLLTGSLGVLYRERIMDNVRRDLVLHINKPYVSKDHMDPNGLKYTWDHLQTALQCCGSQNYTDWFRSVHWPKNNFVPDSCCDKSLFKEGESIENCGQNFEHRDLWYQQGCYKPFTNWLLRHGKFVVAFSFVFIVVDICVFVTALRIFFFVRRKELDSGVYRYRRGVAGNDNLGQEER
ncbi:hypothetical protein L596_003678 [Steinernema carpocapsae]|uniref:Tetraspanin n=1 Tax=Steinernema carpocapsae TaxID=34508 RepID=A0A4U8UUY8_STECR|nr:hypothetical protein L596_003678 [Steinernema carpocapsae]